MTPKSFVAFSTVTAILVVSAIAVVASRPAPTMIPRDRALVFAGLDAKINDVQTLEIKMPSRSFTLNRTASGWGIKELNGYPAGFDKLKTVIVQLSQFKYLEPKTSDPERYSRLNLQNVDAKGAESRQVIVRAKDGKELANGLIGKRNEDLFGSGRGGTYMRFGDKKQTWLIEGTASLGEGAFDWVKKDLIDVKSAKIKRLEIVSAKGGTVVVKRDTPTAKDFKLEGIPAGKRQRGQWETTDMANLLENLKLKDLRRADEISFGDDVIHKGTIQTFDGLLIHSEGAVIGKKYWIRLSASVDAANPAVTDDIRSLAKTINARHKGFVYEIDEKPGKKLTCDHINLLEGAGIKACA
jgi:hypothetical protein